MCQSRRTCEAVGILTGELIARARRRSRTTGIALKVRALLQVLLLTGSVLRSDLLAVDALHGQAFVVFCTSGAVSMTVWYRYCRRRIETVPFALNSMNAA